MRRVGQPPDLGFDLETSGTARRWHIIRKMADVEIRPARADDLAVLSELALRSKGYWGYDPGFLAACRAELTITPDRLKSEAIRVATHRDGPIGFCAVRARDQSAELMDLFVEPAFIGRGVGRLLWNAAVAEAGRLGRQRLLIESDPHAEAWYRRRGAVVIGQAPSGSIPGRTLPLLEYRLAAVNPT